MKAVLSAAMLVMLLAAPAFAEPFTLKSKIIYNKPLSQLMQTVQADKKAPKEMLTEREVVQFIAKMNSHIQARNHQGVISMFSPQASIQVDLDGQSLSYTRAQYYDMMQRGAGNVAGQHRYEPIVNSIEVKGAQALIVLTVREEIETGTLGTLTSDAQEMAMLQKVNGNVWITQFKSKLNWGQKI